MFAHMYLGGAVLEYASENKNIGYPESSIQINPQPSEYHK
jgi:hypothetical protein